MHVFVYGTLTEPEQVGRLVDSFVFVGPATLEGLHPVQGRYPTLAPGGQTPGRLLRTAEIAALDEYEGVDGGLYTRTQVPLVGAAESGEDGGAADDEADRDSGHAAVYVGDPERLDVDREEARDHDREEPRVGDREDTSDADDSSDRLWPGGDRFEERVRRYVGAHDVRVVGGGRS